MNEQPSSAGANVASTEPTPNVNATSRNSVMHHRAYQKPSEDQLRQKLEPLAYEVTQRDATEPPFRNRYWDHHEEGLYVDVVSGEPLFSSREKFDSGTGWPSFTAPVGESVVTRTDTAHGMRRTEVRSKRADSHLGHVFEDGPGPKGLRYCINSAALRFIPKARLADEGYSEYLSLFDAAASSTPTAQAAAPQRNSCSDGSEPAGCQATVEEAYLAGGCFWGMQELLRKIPGVLETEVGYTGGSTPQPSYEQVRTGKTGHAESVRITFDPKRLSYADLLEKWFFRMHDPTTPNRQGNDMGSQYRSVIFVTSPEQRAIALDVIGRVGRSDLWKGPIVTEIAQAGQFTPAESYHQDYLQKHPGGYTCHYLR